MSHEVKSAATPNGRLRQAKAVVSDTVAQFFRLHSEAVTALVECDDPRGYDILRDLFREEINKQIAAREAADAQP